MKGKDPLSEFRAKYMMNVAQPHEFERMVCEYFRSNGYKAEMTPYSGDYGVDVFAVKGKEKLAIQAKMYGSSSRMVNRQAMMELYGAAAYFDCTGAVLATDGQIMADAVKVAEKLGIKLLYLNADTGTGQFLPEKSPLLKFVSSSSGEVKSASGKNTDSVFDELWSKYIMPLKGRTLVSSDGKSNVICNVDWAGVERITSNGRPQSIKIEIFRYAVHRILEDGYVYRTDINQNYTGRASSGIVLILSQIPDFELLTSPSGLKLREGSKLKSK